MAFRVGHPLAEGYIQSVREFSVRATYIPADPRERDFLTRCKFVVLERVDGVTKLWNNHRLFERLSRAGIDVFPGSRYLPSSVCWCKPPEYILVTDSVFRAILRSILVENQGRVTVGGGLLDILPDYTKRCSYHRCRSGVHAYTADRIRTDVLLEEEPENSTNSSGYMSRGTYVPGVRAANNTTHLESPPSLPSGFIWPAEVFGEQRE